MDPIEAAWTNEQTVAFIESRRSLIDSGLGEHESKLLLEDIDGAEAYLRLKTAEEEGKKAARKELFCSPRPTKCTPQTGRTWIKPS
jgi:hypothetical protein